MTKTPRNRHPTGLSDRIGAALAHAELTVPELVRKAQVQGYTLRMNTVYGMLMGKTKEANPTSLWIIHKVTGVSMADLSPTLYTKPRNNVWPLLLDIQALQNRDSPEMAQECGIAVSTYRSLIRGGRITRITKLAICRGLELAPNSEAWQKIMEAEEPPAGESDEVEELEEDVTEAEVENEVEAEEPPEPEAPPEPPPPTPPVVMPSVLPVPDPETEYQNRLALTHWMLVQALRSMMDLIHEYHGGADLDIVRSLATAINDLAYNEEVEKLDQSSKILMGIEILLDPQVNIAEHGMELMRLMVYAQSRKSQMEATSDLEDSLLSLLDIAMRRRKELQL